DHLITLLMVGNDEITQRYLNRLQEKYAPGKSIKPNIGKGLTADQKAKLGGASSGMPGGWKPQNEKNTRKFDRFRKKDLISSANKPINKQGLSAVARAWDKHAGRPGGTFKPLKGNIFQKNAAAEQFVRSILNNPNTVRNELARGGLEYRLPNGKGIRFNADGSFNTVLDPKVMK
ncbi:filamentous hemagglutinin, partial [Xenorhabdus japonica]